MIAVMALSDEDPLLIKIAAINNASIQHFSFLCQFIIAKKKINKKSLLSPSLLFLLPVTRSLIGCVFIKLPISLFAFLQHYLRH
jgi:hypothetical protein